MQEESVYLFMREGSSDKVYNLHLRDCGDGTWRTDYENARRGGSLKPKVKIEPLPYAKAKAEFDKVLAGQLRKGYTPDASGVRFLGSELAGRVSGEVPNLPSEADASQEDMLLSNPAYCLQEKADGENRTLKLTPGDVLQGINKKGLFTTVPETWAQDYRALGESFVIAGEAVGERFYAFDLLEIDGEDLRGLPFESRYKRLVELADLPAGLLRGFEVLPAYFEEADKRAHWDHLRQNNREGGVFKQVDAAFVPGKNNSTLKLKFNEESTFEVIAHNRQRSVQIGAYDDAGQLVPLGSVTIPANAEVPAVGSFIDVIYLYRFEDGALEQPVFSKPRNDQDRSDARLSQITRIKLKSDFDLDGETDCSTARSERPSM